MNKKIILENGEVFKGKGFGYEDEVITEFVFNTSMVGYQEIISDNSYASQGVVMTYPLIGNYGINNNSSESVKPFLDALVVKECTQLYSHYQAEETLDNYLKRTKVCGIEGVDTRRFTRVLRDCGSQKGIIVDIDADEKKSLKKLKAFNLPTDQVKTVSITKPYIHEGGKYKVVLVDFGVKLNMIRSLRKLDCEVIVVPFNTTYEEIKSLKPDGILLSNGPGNPQDVIEAQELIKQIQGFVPIFGICLGHQLLALAGGCKVKKLKFGHRGANHPVKNLKTNKIEITSQNHSYEVSEINQENFEITHINLLDNTCEGLKHKKYPTFSVQYHPESFPGPEDSFYLFEQFIELMDEAKEKNEK